jgi:hypothetical protein
MTDGATLPTCPNNDVPALLGHWYGRYYADWDAAHPGAWVRGELVPGGFYGSNWGGSTLAGTPIGSANTEPRCPKVCTT